MREAYGVEIVAFVSSVGTIKLFEDRPITHSDDIDTLSSSPEFLKLVDPLTREKVDEFLPVRYPDTTVAKRMEDKIAEMRGSRHNNPFVSATVADDATPSAGVGIPPSRL